MVNLTKYHKGSIKNLKYISTIFVYFIDSATKPDSAVPESSTNLFNQLPKPVKDTNSVIEEDDEFLHKKDPQPDIVKPKTRITIPLLSDVGNIDFQSI